MQLTITNNTIARSGKFLNKEDNPIVKAIQEAMPWLNGVTAHQNRVAAIDTGGRKIRFVVRPAFSPRQYHDLVTEKSSSVTCSLEPVAETPTDHDIE